MTFEISHSQEKHSFPERVLVTLSIQQRPTHLGENMSEIYSNDGGNTVNKFSSILGKK